MDLKDLLSKASEHLSVSRAFGVAYEKDGSLVIPVAFVAGGGGGGGTDDPPARHARGRLDIDDDDDDVDDDDDEFELIDDEDAPLGGSGGGFGGVVMPIGVYVVKDDQVRWVPALNMTFIAVAALGLVRVLARSASKRHRRHH
jgi:uncharacterized spore protein YtfJ